MTTPEMRIPDEDPTNNSLLQGNKALDVKDKNDENIGGDINKLSEETSEREGLLQKTFLSSSIDFQDKDNKDDESVTQKDLNSITEKVNKKFESENSAKAILLKKPEVQTFLANLISEQKEFFEKHKTKANKEKAESNNGKNKSDKDEFNEGKEQTDIVESWEEYLSHEATPENFEEFLLSDKGIRILKDEIDNHIDEDGSFNEKYKISKKDLKIKLRSAWYESMHNDYNKNNDILSDNETKKMQDLGKKVVKGVDKAVSNYIKGGGEIFNENFVQEIEKLLSNEENKKLIEEVKGNDKFKDEFRGSLKENIRKFSNIVCKDKKKVSLDTGDPQVDLQLRAYLYLYGRFFYPDVIKPDQSENFYERTLLKIMKAILVYDGDLKTSEYNEFIELERLAEEARKQRDIKRRQEIAARNIERNNRLGGFRPKDLDIIDNNSRNFDINNATGAQIAANAGLGKKLSEYKIDIGNSNTENKAVKQIAFRRAWGNFINSHSDLKEIFSFEDISVLYDIDNHIVRSNKREEFKEKVSLFGKDPDKVYSVLNTFSAEYNDTINNMHSHMDNDKDIVEASIRESAIGCVIDNVKLALSSKGFKFDTKEPVKRQGNNIIISGEVEGSKSVKGTKIKVRYDLNTGELFMNSLIEYSEDNSKITLSNNYYIDDDKINEHIGQISKFDDLLKNEYNLEGDTESTDKRPLNNPAILGGKSNRNKQVNMVNKINTILDKNVSLMSETIISDSKRQSTKVSTITKFMRTFNIMSDTGGFKNLEFNKGSNLFDIIQILDNTGHKKEGNIGSLEYFNNEFMPIIMKYSGLRWGERNENQNKQNDYSEKLFNYKGDDKNINSLKDKINNFNPEQFEGVANYDGSHNLPFADFIINNFTIGSNPNRQLDEEKMRNFKRDLENTDDSELNKQLDNI